MEDWAEIRRLHRAEGLPIKAIVRVLGVSRNTVRSAIASDSPPKYLHTPAGSIVDEVEPRIRELLQSYPTMPATVIAERIGWDRGLTVFKKRVAKLRPVYLPPDPAGRTSRVAGEIAQWPLRQILLVDAQGRVHWSPPAAGFTALGEAIAVERTDRTVLFALIGPTIADAHAALGIWRSTESIRLSP